MLRSAAMDKVDALVAAWNGRDIDEFVAQLSPEVSWHDLGMPNPPAVGRESVRRFARSVLDAFPDFTYSIRAPVCVAENGASCCVPWTITATHTAVLDPPGFAPTNRTVRFDGLDYLVFDDAGLILRIETRFDPADAIEQLIGIRIRPPAGSVRERLLVTIQRITASAVRFQLRRRTDPSRGPARSRP